MTDVRAAALVAVVAIAPLAIILIVAMLRGYDISLTMRRRGRRREGDR